LALATLLDGDPAPPKRGKPSIFGQVYCGQTAGWIKMPLGTEVGLHTDHIVLDGDPARPKKGTQSSPLTSAHVYCGQSVAYLSYC